MRIKQRCFGGLLVAIIATSSAAETIDCAVANDAWAGLLSDYPNWKTLSTTNLSDRVADAAETYGFGQSQSPLALIEGATCSYGDDVVSVTMNDGEVRDIPSVQFNCRVKFTPEVQPNGNINRAAFSIRALEAVQQVHSCISLDVIGAKRPNLVGDYYYSDLVGFAEARPRDRPPSRISEKGFLFAKATAVWKTKEGGLRRINASTIAIGERFDVASLIVTLEDIEP